MLNKFKNKNLPIPWNDTFNIWDSTKLSELAACERKSFWARFFGWVKDYPSIDLDFGGYVHRGMELITQRVGDYDGDTVTSSIARKAFLRGLDEYRECFPPEEDEDSAPKNPPNALIGYVEYMNQYKEDDFEVLKLPNGEPATELCGSVLIDPTKNRRLFYKIDAVCRDLSGRMTQQKGSIFVLEHKTSSKDDPIYRDAHRLGNQANLYPFALRAIFPEEDVFGIVFNFLIFRKMGNKFIRMPVQKSLEQTVEWIWRANTRLDWLEHNMELLCDCKQGDPVLYAFPMNESACFDYHRPCLFHQFCLAISNPLDYYRPDNPPPGLRQEFWNPQEENIRAGLKVLEER